MIYRIDFERFLLHAIDHFTRDELSGMYYPIISAGINSGGREPNMKKYDRFYPDYPIQHIWKNSQDINKVRKAYFEQLKSFEKDIYALFIDNLLKHVNICILCRESENVYIDLLCEYLKKYKIEVIDLNRLFKEGRAGPIYIDRKAIWNSAVGIRRAAAKEMISDQEKSPGGRMKLLKMMRRREKIAKLEELGFNVTKADYDNLDQLLEDEWVNVEDIDEK